MRSKKVRILFVVLIILCLIACSNLPADIKELFTAAFPWIVDENWQEYSIEPTIVPQIIVLPNESEGSMGDALLKPVRFLNSGTIPYTVEVATYKAPDGSAGLPSDASTVTFPGGNTSNYLSLPLGTYTWCYWWDIGDVDGDKILDYRHAIDNRNVILNESDSDQREFAETVTLAAPAGANEQVGKCGESGIQPNQVLSTAENLTIRAFIDGRSQLIITGDSVYWYHIDFAAPGYAYREPTTVNGVEWTPIWPEPAPSENRDCNCASSKYSGVPPLSRTEQTVKLVVIESRDADMIKIAEQPSASNNFKLVVEIYDYSGGYGWYEFTLEYD